jgi:hypothetical protein
MGSGIVTMVDHPRLEELLAFASGEDVPEVSPLATHVSGCAECAGVLARYREIANTVRADDAPLPAASVVARAKALFAEQMAPEPARDLLAPLRRIVAELIFDSGGGLTPALAGFRGGGERHLTYVAEAVQVDLRLVPPLEPEGAWRVHGQLDADDQLPLALVDMVPPGMDDAVAQTMTDQHGVFALAAPAGRYDMLVRLPDVIRVLPGLDLR